MKTLLATTLGLALLLPAAAQASGPACDVSVQFGSYAMGIDGRAFDKVQRYVAHHPRLIGTSSVISWGREGEKTVCMTTTARRGTTTAFHDIKALVGAYMGKIAAMPAWEHKFNDEQVVDLVVHIRTFTGTTEKK